MADNELQQEQSRTSIVSVSDFFLSIPLYERVEINEVNTELYSRLTAGGDIFDSYCPLCEKDSVFEIPQWNDGALIISGSGTEKQLRRPPERPEHSSCHTQVAVCTRNNQHKIEIFWKGQRFFHLEDKPKRGYFLKIGSWPTLGDLAGGQLNEFSKVIDAAELGDLKRGLYLSAHGLGIASYVYLRRVFENLLAKEARKDESIKYDKWELLHTSEKIAALKESLPEFLVQNKDIYSMLSLGIHKLKEEQCLAHFGILFESICLILEQREADRKKEKHKRTLAQGLQKAREKIKQTNE
jgi:hypothetical protein